MLMVKLKAGSTQERILNGLVRRCGYKLAPSFPPNIPESFESDAKACAPFTMTSTERMYSLARAVTFVTECKLPGAFVEAGVWKGGSALLMARTLLALGVTDRELWLYDTFAGMSEPTLRDGSGAVQQWAKMQSRDHNEWCYAPIEEVRATMAQSGYPMSNVHLIAGKVEETIPANTPHEIALLRLDTDWYESTRHELLHLWPRLLPGGVLIIDDYGRWQGSRRAVDEFFVENGPVLMHRIDSTGVAVQKAS